MTDPTEQSASRPRITMEAILLAIKFGANCPCRLARVFGVHMLHPDLVHTCNDLAKLRLIAALAHKHTGPSGLTCTVITITPPHAEAGQ